MIGSVVAVAIAAVVILVVANQRLRSELAVARSRLDSTRRSSGVTATGSGQAEASAKITTQPDPAKPVADAPRQDMSELRAKWKDPSWRAARFNEAYIRVEQQYGRLLSRLPHLTAEKREQLISQLANNELNLAEASMPVALPMTEAESKQQADALQQAIKENEERVREVLDDSQFAAYETAVKADPYQGAVESLTNSMRANGLQINEDQQSKVLEAYAASCRVLAETPTTDGVPAGSEQDRQLRRAAFQKELMRRLSGVLNEQQINALLQAEMESAP
jgi:hypothetical protein